MCINADLSCSVNSVNVFSKGPTFKIGKGSSIFSKKSKIKLNN